MHFLKKIFSPSCLIISLLLLTYTYYQSEIYWNGENSNYYLIYYIISISLIFFSIFTFFLNREIKEYLIISLISIVVSLYIFEGYLTFNEIFTKEQLTKEQLYEQETGNKYDARTLLEIYEDLKNNHNNIQVYAPPRNYLNSQNNIFPLSGISNSKTIYCNENGYYSTYESDRYGFNNPDKEWSQKEIEYLLIGDSFTHGACVNRPNDIASVLRTLTNKSVLNLGYYGNAPLIEYATLREYLNPNVKKVLWIYNEGNDLGDLDGELTNDVLNNYLNDLAFTQNLKIKQKEINDSENITIERTREGERERFSFKLNEFIKIQNLRYLLIPQSQRQPQTQPQPQPEFLRILELVKDLTANNNSKLYFIYLPDYGRYKSNYDNGGYLSVKKIANELDVPFINIHTQVFEKEENALKLFSFELAGHYNVEGYRKVAETIYTITKD